MSLARHLRHSVKQTRVMLSQTSTVLTQSRRHLPLCTVDTNVKRTDLPSDVHKQISKVVADVLGKDEKVVSVTVNTEVPCCREGNDHPNAVVSIWSIGVFDPQKNPTYVKPLYDFLVPTLKMPADRIALFFHPISKESAGHLLYQEQTSGK